MPPWDTFSHAKLLKAGPQRRTVAFKWAGTQVSVNELSFWNHFCNCASNSLKTFTNISHSDYRYIVKGSFFTNRGSGKIMVVPVLIRRSLFLSKLSSFIQLTGNSWPYCTEHFISTDPPISVTISGWVMKDMVGLLSLPVAEATSRARLRKVKVTHILISHLTFFCQLLVLKEEANQVRKHTRQQRRK